MFLQASRIEEHLLSFIFFASLAMADGEILLNDKALELLVVLHMNRNYMVFMRKNYFLEIKCCSPLTWKL
jgi:hypothetical protein